MQPVNGVGLILVNTHGGAERRICTNLVRCGSPRTPRWSPDGRALAFNASTVHLIYPDGSCLDCKMGGAGTPAFTANPTLVTFESDGALIEDGIDDIRKATILTGKASDAVWSAGGQLALVRAGIVWAGTPPHGLRRIGAGSSPSWSPNGARIALARKGWIVVVSVRTRSARRLVRGSTPAFSPDGKSIAFVGAGHHLLVVPASGGRARRVGNVRGVAVDWQPVPRNPTPGCAAPPGSTVITNSPAGDVTADTNSAKVAYMGCLAADGRERLLEEFDNDDGADTVVDNAAVGSDYAALANDYTDGKYQMSSVTVAVFDLLTGAAVPHRGDEELNCSNTGCVAGTSQIVVGSGGVSAADLTAAGPPGSSVPPLQTISCPSASFCAGLGGESIFTTTNPAGGAAAWTAGTELLGLNQDITCPSASFCAGVGGESVFTSTNPTGGTAAWTATSLDAGTTHTLMGISCPSPSLCVAVDNAGNVFSTTDPAGGTGAWTPADVDGTTGLRGITCPSASLCVAIDGDGNAIASSDPTGGAGAWQPATLSNQPDPVSVSCPSATLCVAVDGMGGDAFTSIDPASGAAWAPVSVPGDPDAVSCPSVSLCLAVGSSGTLDVSTDPTAGAWTSSEIDNGEQLVSIDCPSSSLCVAADRDGDVVTSTDPTGGSAAWTAALLAGDPCPDTDWCTTEQIVASDSTGVHTLDTITGPGMGSLLTDLSLSGNTLTWEHAGSPETATLP